MDIYKGVILWLCCMDVLKHYYSTDAEFRFINWWFYLHKENALYNP